MYHYFNNFSQQSFHNSSTTFHNKCAQKGHAYSCATLIMYTRTLSVNITFNFNQFALSSTIKIR